METTREAVIDEVLRPAATQESAVEAFIDLELGAKPHRRNHDQHIAGPLPLIIGITGHRDVRPEDVTSLEASLRSEFERLRELYPSTPFVVLNSLAEGSDRLAARVALELGFRLVVVLPMARDLYEADFAAESLGEFRALLAQAEHSFELPLMSNRMPEEVVPHGPAREQQYAQVGAYLASHSTILFALWDGVHLNKVGGTSQIVRFKLEGVPAPYARTHSELDAPDCGPVYQIVTPRHSNPNTTEQPFTVRKIYPSEYASREDAEQAFRDIYERMETLNSDAVRYSSELRDHFTESEAYLFPEDLTKELPEPLRGIRAFYAITD